MSSKLFKESDSWGDSSGSSAAKGFSFKKIHKSKDKKNKNKAKKRNHSEIEDDPSAGKFVRAPKYYGLDHSYEDDQPTKKKNKNKRKHEVEVNDSSDGATPMKKIKKQSQPEQEEEPAGVKSFGDNLRESLKGSRFRFLNEQMYKQTGRESMKVFQEDDTAFEAYHEGYRAQVKHWPMNPIDRIINAIKRL